MIAHALLLGPRLLLLRGLGLRPFGGRRLVMLPLAVMLMFELLRAALIPLGLLIAAGRGATLRGRRLLLATRTLRAFVPSRPAAAAIPAIAVAEGPGLCGFALLC